jgi:hypothetical protein
MKIVTSISNGLCFIYCAIKFGIVVGIGICGILFHLIWAMCCPRSMLYHRTKRWENICNNDRNDTQGEMLIDRIYPPPRENAIRENPILNMNGPTENLEQG